MTLYIHNPGELDLRGLTLMGASAKTDAASAIGEFGTGLKYAVSVLLRHNAQVELWIGTARYTFEIRTEKFRDTEIKQIYLLGEGSEAALPFTLNYGKNWKPWMAYRELRSNAMDEGGGVSTARVAPQGNRTLFVISCPEIEAVHADADHYFCETQPVASSSHIGIEIHPGVAGAIFYKGVRVGALGQEGVLGLYNYNFKSGINLTEDRTISNVWLPGHRIRDYVASEATNADLISRIIGTKGVAESEINFAWVENLSELFCSIVCKRIAKGQYVNHTAVECVQRHMDQNVRLVPATLNAVQERQLTKAKDFCARALSHEITYPIKIYKTLGQGVYGRADLDAEEILIALDTFGMGTKFLATTLLEEQLHLQTGHKDCTRELQNYLINLIGTLGEQIIGEPI